MKALSSDGGRCGAKTRSGGTCQKSPMRGFTRCRNHGAGAGRPPAAGPGSRYFPPELQADLDRALRDEDRLSLKFEIVACDVRASQVFESLTERCPSKAWKAAWMLYQDGTSGSGTAACSMDSLGELLEAGVVDSDTWGELQQLFENRRRLTHTEAVLQHQLDQFMTKRQAQAVGSTMVRWIRENVPDPNAQAMFIADIVSLFRRPAKP